MGEKTPFRGRRAPHLAGGVAYLLRRALSRAKKTPFGIRRAPLLAKRRPYNAQGTKIDSGLR